MSVVVILISVVEISMCVVVILMSVVVIIMCVGGNIGHAYFNNTYPHMIFPHMIFPHMKFPHMRFTQTQMLVKIDLLLNRKKVNNIINWGHIIAWS